jgi:hypothetical protein
MGPSGRRHRTPRCPTEVLRLYTRRVRPSFSSTAAEVPLSCSANPSNSLSSLRSRSHAGPYGRALASQEAGASEAAVHLLVIED